MTTYLVALMVVVASIQIYLIWRLLGAFDVLRRFEERLTHFGDALSLLTETAETGFDSLGRELERLRALGEVRAELRGASKPAPAAPRHAVAEALAEALIARADATPAHTLVARTVEPARPDVTGPSVAFVQVAGASVAPAPATVAVARTLAPSAAVPAASTPASPDSVPVLRAEPAPPPSSSDPVGDVVRLIESAQGRPSAAQLNEAAVRLRMHLAGGTARARSSGRASGMAASSSRQEKPNGALRS